MSPCRYPEYGHRCQYQCKCNIANCNHKTGCTTGIVNDQNHKMDIDVIYICICIISGEREREISLFKTSLKHIENLQHNTEICMTVVSYGL